MQRRTFIHLSAYTALALTLPLVDSCKSGTEKAISQPLFFSHIADIKTINGTGADYRRLFPAEDSKAILTQLLLGTNPSTDKGSIQKLLDDHVEQDFKTGKIVTAKGWVLSQTEARQCALFSILNT